MKLKNITFGSDIEFFLQTNMGQAFPAIGLCGGTKSEPKPLPTPGYFIQEDNVAVEFNIPVCKTPKEFTKAVRTGYDLCVSMLPPTVQPLQGASVEFELAYLNSPQAVEFGCEPDICAWSRKINPRPRCANRRLRSAGGHVHIGWENPDMEDRFELIKACDVFAGIPSLTEDGDNRRRELYGKAGAMRIKPYGVEHRLLSNYWLFHPDHTANVINRYKKATDFINYGHKISEEDSEAVQNAINRGNYKSGSVILRKYQKLLDESIYVSLKA